MNVNDGALPMDADYPDRSKQPNIWNRVTRWRAGGAVALCVGLFLVYVALSSGADTSEGLIHYQLTQQILMHHRISFDKPLPSSLRGPDGKFYLQHEIGNSLWMMPTVVFGDLSGAVLRRLSIFHLDKSDRLALFLIVFNAAFYVAVSCMACYYIATRGYGVSRRIAFAAALILAFGSLMLPYSKNLFDGVAAGTFLTIAVCLVLPARSSRDRRFSFLCGVAIGLSLITRITAVLAIPALLLYLALGRDRNRKVPAFLAGVVPFLAWQCWYDFIRTGSPFISGTMMAPVMEGVPGGHNAMASPVGGLVGLLFSPDKSMLIYTPCLALVPFALRAAWSRDRWLTMVIGWIACTYVVVIASLTNADRPSAWAGDWGWGPRYLVVIEPLVFVFVAVFLQRFRFNEVAQRSAGVLAALGALINLPATLGNWHFRMSLYEVHHGRLVFPIWDPLHAQWLDMWQGLIHNINFVAGYAPLLVVPGYSATDTQASNTLNLWWLTARQFGLPPLLGAGLGVMLLAVGLLVLATGWMSMQQQAHGAVAQATLLHDDLVPQSTHTSVRLK